MKLSIENIAKSFEWLVDFAEVFDSIDRILLAKKYLAIGVTGPNSQRQSSNIRKHFIFSGCGKIDNTSQAFHKNLEPLKREDYLSELFT